MPLLIFALIFVTSITSASAEISISDLSVKSGHHAAAAHLSLLNSGSTDDALLSVESNGYGRVELHTMTMNDNIMKMRRVELFDLPAGKTRQLKPMGDHLMLFDQREHTGPLTFTFTFRDSPPVTLAVPE